MDQQDDEQDNTSRTTNEPIPAGYNRASTNITMSEEARAERQTSQHQQMTNRTTPARRRMGQHQQDDERATTSKTTNGPPGRRASQREQDDERDNTSRMTNEPIPAGYNRARTNRIRPGQHEQDKE